MAKLKFNIAACTISVLRMYHESQSIKLFDTLISLELGSAMRVSVLKLDQTSFDVAVMNSATIKDLKLAVKKKVNEMEQSKMGHESSSPRLI
ncbi:U11/U12 small nuclear ribonucleoprotein 25 kDa protein [Tanacetum coccineum]